VPNAPPTSLYSVIIIIIIIIIYRNLGTKNIEAREPPSMAEAETYWKSLWGEEAQHNERAE